jgi:anti-sigma B factor antagonist
MDFRIERDRIGMKCYLSGRLDAAAMPQLTDALGQLLNSGCSQALLDLGGVEYVGSSGITSLRQFHQNITSKGGSVSIVSCRPQVAEVFRVAQLDRLFNI